MSTTIHDIIENEKASNCCGSSMYELGDNYICTDCKEYCEAVEDEEGDGTIDKSFNANQEGIIAQIMAEASQEGI